MLQKAKVLFQKHKEPILYLIFGGLTTAVDFGISFLLYRFWIDAAQVPDFAVHAADVIAWVAAVAFAFVTNRIWVFESKKRGFAPVARELLEFAGGRILTLLLQEAVMAIAVTWLGGNKYLFRILAAVMVIILNYVISKLIVFKASK